uniref:DDE Tnp4 domain-containing protein n=1 Tax=Paramormyrops kingsleyae TaxID=1676925 RepID=A0A3B3SU41_9TELE
MDSNITMADLALHDLAQGTLIRECRFWDHADLLAESDKWLISHFRLPRSILLHLCTIVDPSRKGQQEVIPEIADMSGISQPSMSCILPGLKGFTSWPTYPGKLCNGAIDCTHVNIKAPSNVAFAYMNRQLFHSINVQLIRDPKSVLLKVFARWPGGTNSSVSKRQEQGAVQDGWLTVGDWGYPLKTWLMTPLNNLQHHRNGLIIMSKQQHRLLSNVCKILAFCVLHNIGMKEGCLQSNVQNERDPQPVLEEPAEENSSAAAIMTRH